MTTRHEKNVERKLRSKERKDAIARSLHSRPLRPINTCGLQTLQTVLGLPMDGFKPDSLGNEAGRREALSNLADVPFADGTSVTVPEPAIHIPRGLGRQEFDVLDAIFIAIDFEYSHYSPKSGRIRLREVGISMFDTRNLYHQNGHLNNAISTQHYRTVTNTRKFIFGQTIDILQDELVTVLKRLLYIENNNLGEIRDLILVGHGFGFEIKAMKGLGIDLTLAPSVIEIFDTEFLGYEVFGRNFKCSLSKVTKEIGILGESFHNAGNDANFTLRAMLLLAIHRYNPSKLDRAQKEKIEMYKKLAKF
ncbi:hypothetical protein EG329_001825 [Mollisiaceae sp. DMI_Dod_QoI]|nr:hypothetical protein EG329_001825 [Helotiales sp. DMI_Dod_QoI]